MQPFEHRVKTLCERILACQTQEDSIGLTRELKTVLHDRIEELRGTLVILPTLDRSTDDSKAA